MCYDNGQYPLQEKKYCGCPSFSPAPIGDWSQCILDVPSDMTPIEMSIGQLQPGHEHCGVGVRTQAVICKAMGDHNASAHVCGTEDFVEEMCFIPCPRDCEMSSWTSWSSCATSGRCGLGLQQRSRYMVESSLDGGRPCPDLIEGEVQKIMSSLRITT